MEKNTEDRNNQQNVLINNQQRIILVGSTRHPELSRKICVKTGVQSQLFLSNCPLYQRVLLTLHEKKVKEHCNIGKIPLWFLETSPGGKGPVININGKWIADADLIVAILEEKYPEPSLKTPPEYASVGSNIYPKFVSFLKSWDPNGETEQALITELKALDEHLRVHDPYVAGRKVTAVDFKLAPQLYHLKIALGNYKKWFVPESLTHVHKYMQLLFSRESFRATKATDDCVLERWGYKVGCFNFLG